MQILSSNELHNISGGFSLMACPTYDIFMKVYKFTYNFVKSKFR